tara:strand:+ start:4295 stop:5074 length:780 start_codon:yes stop_codon:yes gene_type:complete
VKDLTSLIMRFSLVLVLGAFAGILGWWTLFIQDQFQGHEIELEEKQQRITSLEGDVRERDDRILELDVLLAAEKARVRELELAIALLKVDHRVAQIEILAQEPIDGRPGVVRTTLRFVELDEAGNPMGAGQEFILDGSRIYLEALVIKFDDTYVEAGDALRGTSVCLFRRLFTEEISPTNGAELDTTGTRPHPYRDDAPGDPFFDELWKEFWTYASDPELAESKGVRTMHGEAPFIEARVGHKYRVELRASGGLTITSD